MKCTTRISAHHRRNGTGQDENNIGAGKLFESERKQHNLCNAAHTTYSPHRTMEEDHSKYLKLGMVSIGLL